MERHHVIDRDARYEARIWWEACQIRGDWREITVSEHELKYGGYTAVGSWQPIKTFKEPKTTVMKWAIAVLSNDEASTDAELLALFCSKGFKEKEARALISARNDFLNNERKEL